MDPDETIDRDDDASTASLPAALLQGELERIVRSDLFAASPRHRRFLEYLVAHALRADGSRPKEMTLGIEVFDRPPSTFDPQRDTIVRVEARRLRARLARYYDEAGADALVEIVLPLGGYVPALRRRPEAARASIAVLPVIDRSGAALGPTFCEDLFDALIDAVARMPGIKVIARHSALQARDVPTGERSAEGALAVRLGVSLLLDGTLDADGDALRLRWRLLRGLTGERLWTGTWRVALDADFATRDALTARVVDEAIRALPASHADRPVERLAVPPVDERARDLVDRGRYLMRQGAADAYPQALQRFRDAAAIAPRYPAAHFGIARALSHLIGMTQIAPDDGIDEARAAAHEALSLDPRHGDAASLLAALRQRFDHDWPAAHAGYLAAVALAPGSLYVHVNYAFGLMFSGRFGAAEAELRLAHELDPLDIGQRATHALLRIYRRDYRRAAAILDALLEDQPRHVLARSLRGAVHLFENQPDDALAQYRLAAASLPDLSIGSVGIAQAHALAGRRAEAESEHAALLERFATRYLSPYQLTLIALRLGDLDEAFALLERAAAERDPNFIAVLVDQSLDRMRGDARFGALLERYGLDRVLPVDAPT